VNPLKVGVVGVGHLGQHHARVYSELREAKLIGVADPDKARAREVAQKCRCDHFGDPAEMLGLVDAVSIVAPTHLHHAVAAPFLKRGVHCLIEKPLSTDLGQADELIAMAKASGAKLQVGHIERFNPALLAIHDKVGDPLFIEAHRLGPYSPRNIDTGVVLELMIHDLDIVRALVGADKKVIKVDAVGLPVLSPTEDIANVRLTFEGGCVANLTASRVTLSKQRKIRLFSKEGYVSVDFLAKQAKVYRLKEGADPTQAGSLLGLTRMVATETLKIRDDEQLKLELAAFVKACREGSAPVVSGEDGREAVRLALLVQEQLRAHSAEVLGGR